MSTLPVNLYEYAVKSMDYVVDGDTADLTIDLGFKTYRTERIRFAGIDAPEHGDEPGYTEAKDYVIDLKKRLDEGFSTLSIVSIRDKHDVYGRYLATLFESTVDGYLDVCQDMLDESLVTAYEPK